MQQAALPGNRKRLGAQVALAGALFGIAVLVLRARLDEVDGNAVQALVLAISPAQWLGAISATILSFWAVARYDLVAHWALQTGVSKRRAGLVGLTAIALSQSIGLNAVTAGVVRWRMLPELGARGAARVTAVVGLSFLAGLGALAASLALLTRGFGGALILVIAIPLITLLLIWPPKLIARMNLPLIGLTWRILGLAAADVGFAGLALYLMLPLGILNFPLFMAVFGLALGSGLIAGTPGGVGPLELTLIAFFPENEAELVAALLAFRLIYYIIPAAVAAVVFGINEWRRPIRRPSVALPVLRSDTLNHGEARLAELGGKRFVQTISGEVLLTARASSAIVAIGPLLAGRCSHTARQALMREAAQQVRAPLLYKCDAVMAAEARRAGWVVALTGREAVIDPARFSIAGAAHRQLRRKLKQAAGAGIAIAQIATGWHRAELHHVATEWANSHGGERGFSMGHAAALNLDLGPVFAARQNGKIIAFVSFLATTREWTLDLMRHRDDVPPGIMHALVTAAIEAAAIKGISRLSLASVPSVPTKLLPQHLSAFLHRNSGAAGLLQFKSAFAPRWESRYISGPNRLTLIIGWLAILRQITAGPPRLSHRQGAVEVASGRPEPEWTRT